MPPTATLSPTPGESPSFTASPRIACPGDCNGDGEVTIDEIITGVDIVLETTPLAACSSFDVNGDSLVTVDELLAGVIRGLDGCLLAAENPVHHE